MRLKPLLLPILIASALLLSAANAESAASPDPANPQSKVSTPQPRETNAQQQKRETARASSANVPTPGHQEIRPQEDQHQTDRYLQTAWRWIVLNWNVSYTIALATSIYAFFAILQWRALKKTVDETQSLVRSANRQAKAAEDQVTNLEKTLAATQIVANAAKSSADAALRSDRPILVAEQFLPQNIDCRQGIQNESVTLVTFQIRNCGKGPALTVELVGNIKLINNLPYPPSFGDCKPIPLRENVVETSKGVNAFVPYAPAKPAMLLPDTDSARVENGLVNLFVYGWIAYRDVHGNRYDSRFSVQYLPVRFSGERFYPSPKEYNRHNEYGPD
jgi:hypothetical protein